MAYKRVNESDIVYDSGDLPKRAGTRSFANGSHYIFRIRGAKRDKHDDERIVLEFHSSVTRGSLRRGGVDGWSGAATTLSIRRDEAHHVLAALLAALQADPDS